MTEGKTIPFGATKKLAEEVIEDLFSDAPPVPPPVPVATADVALSSRVTDAAIEPSVSSIPDAVMADPSIEAGVGLSPEALERQHRARVALFKQAEMWRERIATANTPQKFDAVTSDAGRNGGKYTVQTGPGFVVGDALRRLFQENSIEADAEKAAIQAKASVLQQELAVLYRAKQAEFYPPRADAVAVTLPLVTTPVDMPKVVDTAVSKAKVAFSLPSRMGNKVLEYRAGGKTIKIWKKSGGYHIQENDGKVLSSSRTDILKRGRSEGWVSAIAPTIPTVDSAPVSMSAVQAVDLTPTLTSAEATVPDTAVVAAAVGRDAVLPDGTKSTPSADPTVAPMLEPKLEPEPKTDPIIPAAPPTIEATPSLEPLETDAKIAKLRDEVTAARTLFLSVEESQQSAWKNLTRVFRNLSHRESDDADVVKYHAQYDAAIRAYVDARLEQLKQSGLGPQELRPQMAALIRELEFEEAEQIYDTRRVMRLSGEKAPLQEKMKALWDEAKEGINGPTAKGEVKAWLKLFVGSGALAGEGVLQAIETVGSFSNKLSRGRAGKYILTATVTVGGAVALGVATGGVASVAIGALALKRLVGGAGLAVAAEAGMDAYAKHRRERKKQEIMEGDHPVLDALQAEALQVRQGYRNEISYAALEEYLKESGAKARRGEGARRRAEAWKKLGAITVGAAIGSGAASHLFARAGILNQYIGGKAQAAPMGTGSGAILPSVSGPGTSGLVSSPDAAPMPAAAVSAPSSGQEALSVKASVVDRTLVSIEKPTKLLSLHKVERGESIWKLAENSVKDLPGMDDRSSGRFAKLVEIHLQEKLSAIDPDLAKAAGFTPDAEGRLTPQHIQAGAKLELGKIISDEEMKNLIAQAKSDALISAPTIEAASVTQPSSVVNPAAEEAVIGTRVPVSSLEEKAAIRDLFVESPASETATIVPTNAVDGVNDLRPEADLLRPDGNVMAYVEKLPREDQIRLLRNFKKLSLELFQTSEVMGGEIPNERYDPALHPELAKAKLAAILADHKTLAVKPLAGYDRALNPLHWSQMEAVAKFSQASAKTFGAELARVRAGESVQEYVLRMAALASHEGKKIPGFRMLD